MSQCPATASVNTKAYIELLKRALTRYPLNAEEQGLLRDVQELDTNLTAEVVRCLTSSTAPLEPCFDLAARAVGRDWPAQAETMIGLYRLENLQNCVTGVLEDGVPGDLIETGAWRGGACIFMRGMLRAFADTQRTVWVADSFQGLPHPDPVRYPADTGDPHWAFSELAVSLETVRANFLRYGLLDNQVRFLPGWFRDTLPSAPVSQLAILRVDGDMYESTIVALRSLYSKLSPGGYVIIDDYGALASCRQAVTDFRNEAGIKAELQPIDWTGVFWRV